MVLYFSATGNSKYCAEKIAKDTEDSVFALKDAMKKGIREIDCGNSHQLGIVVPTYDWGIPWAVADYLRNVRLVNLPEDAYIFSVHTCGNMTGASAVRMKELVEAKGLHLNAAFSVLMTQSEYLFGIKTSPEKREKIMSGADVTLDEIVSEVRQRKEVTRMRKPMPAFAESVVSSLAGPSQRKVKKFRVTDDCIGCGTCSRGCPQNIIQMRDKRPVWTEDRCLNCLACISNCPKKAIRNR